MVKHKSGFFIDCEKTQSDEIFKLLNLYKIRAKVEILNLNSEVAGYILELDNEKGEVSCKIPRLPLGEGTYSINIQAIVNTGVADWINEVCTFEILPGDYYGTGIVDENNASFYCISEWERLN